MVQIRIPMLFILHLERDGQMNGTPNGCTWSRCQRNYPKSGNTTDYPQYLGPQGDVRYVYNFVRCVRNIDTSIK